MDDRIIAAYLDMLRKQGDSVPYPDELINALSDAGLKNEREKMLGMQMSQALAEKNTPMPQGMTVRDQYIAPSPVAVAASTLQQILGGQENMALQKQYADLLKNYGKTAADKYRFDAAYQQAQNAKVPTPRPSIPGAFSPAPYDGEQGP